jgi:PQQ-like domain
MRRTSVFSPQRLGFACVLVGSLQGCGSRSGLLYEATSSTGGDGGNAGDGGKAGNGGSGGVVATDPCPASVSGPKAMFRNCSTRDGRARVGAPKNPHTSWSTKLPTDSTGQLGSSALATDASGHVYVVTTGAIDQSVAAIRRVQASSGTIVWTVPINPDQETGTPIILSSGGVDLFAYSPSSTDSVFTFDPSTGMATSTTFGFSLYYAPGELAVGADESLYVTHSDGVGTANPKTTVSRVGPDGSVLWTSVDLATLGPPPLYGDVFPSSIALGKNDLVVIATDFLLQSSQWMMLSAFDPATGAVNWSTPLTGQLVGGPVVRSDGSIVALSNSVAGSAIAYYDPAGGAVTVADLSAGAFEIFAVTENGVVLAGADDGNGITGIEAIADYGTTLWTHPGVRAASIARDGTVVAFDATIMGLDEATGKTKWELSPAVQDSCILDAALTSDGRIVALQCDGTLFGASD